MRYLIIAAALIGVLGTVGLNKCDELLYRDLCGHTMKAEVPSPDGRYVANVFEHDCGATTGFSMQVLLREADESFDPYSQTRILVLEGRDVAHVAWTGERDVLITLPEKIERTFRKLDSWQDVRIAYK